MFIGGNRSSLELIQNGVDRNLCVCRMRISLEGHTGTTGVFERVNCLKVLRKKLLRFFEITVDRVEIRCRMRPSKSSMKQPVSIGSFGREASETT